jgi:hypothetical protein
MTDIVLVNGSKDVRVRNSEGCTVLDCGCAHDPIQWLQQCRAHNDEANALHAQAAADHRLQQLERELT